MYNAKGRVGKTQILKDHLLMVNKLAYQLKAKLPANVEVDDLIQAGMIGLLDALGRYEDTQQAQFETYASQRIRGAMLDELRSMDWLPRNVRQNMRKIEAAIAEVQQQVGRQPTEIEIAKKLDLTIDEYQKMLFNGAGHQLCYIEDFHSENDGDHFLEWFNSDSSGDPLQALVNHDMREAVVQSIEALPARENLMMGLYYEHELNLKEIGAIMGVTESRVSQLHSQAIARIRVMLRGQKWTGEA